jgi:hypothetical protein
MTRLSDITKITLPLQAVNEVYEHLRNVGSKGLEGVALWGGEFEQNTFHIKTTIIPKQTAYSHEEGLLYSVDGDELHRINVWLYENKQRLVAQIHSHPSEAYHSSTDDAYPIVAANGGISIVVPDFAFAPFKLEDWAIFRLVQNDGWVQLTQQEIQNLIQII